AARTHRSRSGPRTERNARGRLRVAAPESWALLRVFTPGLVAGALDRRTPRGTFTIPPVRARGGRELVARPRQGIQVVQAPPAGREAGQVGGTERRQIRRLRTQ